MGRAGRAHCFLALSGEAEHFFGLSDSCCSSLTCNRALNPRESIFQFRPNPFKPPTAEGGKMLRPMWPPAHAPPPSPMHLQSPAICPGPTATAAAALGPGGGCSAQETRVPVLPEHEAMVRASYVLLAVRDELLQELAG